MAEHHFGERPRKLAARGGGLTNSVYEFTVAHGTFMLRAQDDPTKIGDYLKERWATAAARAAGVPTPRLLEVGHTPEGHAYMIAEEVHGLAGTDSKDRVAVLRALGKAALLLHRVRTRGFGTVSDWSDNRLSKHDSWAGWLAHGYDVERRLATFVRYRMLDRAQCARLRKQAAEIAAWRKRPVLHHGDLRLKNVIVDERTGRLVSLIDWDDCVSMPGAHWDLSVALHDLGVDEKEAFLEGYGATPRTFVPMLPVVRFFNLLNYEPAVQAAGSAGDRKGLELLRLRLSGGLDLY